MNIEAQKIMRMLVESLGMARTLELLASEAEECAIRCGTSERWQSAARNYLSVRTRLRNIRSEVYEA